MRVWRIHIKNDYATGYTRQDLFNFCQKEKLIGVGWAEITTRINSDDAIRKQAQRYSEPIPAIKALNAMRAMKINDLIWTRYDRVYYLCRVTNVWENSKPNDIHNKLDICNYVNVEWLEIGPEYDVPGKVVSSFRPAASAQAINDVEKISMYLWDKYSRTKTYNIPKTKMNIWTILSAEAIEELVLLYLQIEKGYHIFSSTVKYAFSTFECQMVDNNGNKAYPQVKSGSVALNADDYMNVFKYDPDANVYLFSTSENYTKNNCKNIYFLYIPELEKFIRNHKSVLPLLTYNWIDLCGFFD